MYNYYRFTSIDYAYEDSRNVSTRTTASCVGFLDFQLTSAEIFRKYCKNSVNLRPTRSGNLPKSLFLKSLKASEVNQLIMLDDELEIRTMVAVNVSTFF